MNPVVVALAVALALSGAGNAFLLNRWLAATEAAAVATTTSGVNLENAKLCSRSVDNLEAQAQAREVDAAVERAKAKEAATAAGKRGQAILRAQPSVPGDDCKSTAAQIDDWLASRPARSAK